MDLDCEGKRASVQMMQRLGSREYQMKRSSVICTLVFCVLPLLSLADTEKAPLLRHTVSVDEHPVAVWEKSAVDASEAILLVHGRTWSALPDFDLQVDGEDLSLMDGLVAEGYAVYAIDMRGYGETPRDSTGWLTPNRAADDVASVVEWISAEQDWAVRPHLFGWSMGSTISQLAVQRHPDIVTSLSLFGYWRDVDIDLPADERGIRPERAVNTAVAAASDFIVPGSISQRAIDAYVAAALDADPIRVDVRSVDQYNRLDETILTLPTLVIAGEHDPLAPAERLARLFTAIGSGRKQWVSVPDSDHAAFLEAPRDYFIHELAGFLRSSTL